MSELDGLVWRWPDGQRRSALIKESMEQSSSLAGYAQSTVAFIDVLGFKEAVRSLKNDETQLSRVMGVISALKEPEESLKTEFHKKHIDVNGDLRATMFSDSVVCTSISGNALSILYRSHMIGCRLMAAGFLCRGGIANGLAFHQDSTFFGEAVIEAHVMESTLASYPRILVSNEIANTFLNAHRALPNGCSKDILMRDTDGFWYVNVFGGPTGYLLANKIVSWPSSHLSNYWRSNMKCIQHGLVKSEQNTKNTMSIRSKYVWAANKHNTHAPSHFHVAL